MARYYDMDKLKALIEAKADTLVEGKEAFLYVAKWLDLLPHEDVVPRSEVAREIFAEIEKLVFVGGFTDEVSNLTILTTKDYEALKKKYGATDTNVGNKYFTAEQVRAMSREEVRDNYLAIMESMKKWGEQK